MEIRACREVGDVGSILTAAESAELCPRQQVSVYSSNDANRGVAGSSGKRLGVL